MTPVFDVDSQHVAWCDGVNLFDPDVKWVAFVSEQGVVCSPKLRRLGSLQDGSLLDRAGKRVAWLDGDGPDPLDLEPLPLLPPLPPLPPLKPLPPLLPLSPQQTTKPEGSWSALSWAQYLSQA